MVVTESLACGTPVVCSSDGGPGEIVSTPEVGRTVPLYDYFDLLSSRRAGELAEAVVQAIELARQPRVSERCRAWAEPWSLERVGAQAEAMLEEMASNDRRTGPVAQVAG
jgi:glycosyltransferase involved in cell wall biosynthesis